DALLEEDRRDLTHLAAFAIDDEGNKDPDDAISLEGDTLWVHVADVGALVRPDSPADRMARGLAANLYLPERSVPMLPHHATELLGLGLREISPALSFGLKLSAEGQIIFSEVIPSRVRVTRLTYEQVEGRLTESPFREMVERTRRYQARRKTRATGELDLPEV